MKNSSLQNLLTRLYVKASHGQPMYLSATEVALYAGSDKRLCRLFEGLNNGGSLAELLQKSGGLSDPFIRIISTGEKTGKLAEALKATLEGLPLASRLRFQGWILQIYLVANLGAVILFLLLYASSFNHMYTSLFGADPRFAGIYGPLLFLGKPAVAVGSATALFALIALFRNRFFALQLRLLPPLARNMRRLISLEIETRYLMMRSSGHASDYCLEHLALDQDQPGLAQGISTAVAAIRNGEAVTAALAPVIEQTRLDAFCSIAVAEATPRPDESLAEQTAFTTAYMKEHLARELTVLFRWATVLCGSVVGVAVVYVFNCFIRSYTLLDYLP